MPVSPAILLVEDNEDDVLLVQRQLQRAGVDFELKVVSNGDEAIRYLAGEEKYSDRENFPMPSLVLLDLNLPIVSGLEVLAWIKERPMLQTLPVIVLTATEDERVIQKALALGANYYIPKPTSAETLKVIVDELLWVHAHPLRVLLVDDDPETLPLLQRILSREFPQAQICRAVTERDFQEAIEGGKFDVVITDYMLHCSNGFKIARKVKERYPNCPVLMLTASGDEEVAAASLKMGIDDYIVKSPSRIGRLPVAIHNALRIARQRVSAQKLEQMLQQSVAKLPCTNVAILNTCLTGDLVNPIFAIDRNGIIRLWSRAGERLWGYSHNDVVGKPVWDLFPDSETKERFSEIVRRVFNEKILFSGIHLPFRAKNGQTRFTQSKLSPVTDESGQVIFCVCCNTDLTDQKIAEEKALRRQWLLGMVLEWGREIASSTDLRSCLKRIHRIVCGEIGFDRVGIFLYAPERNVVYRVSGTDRNGRVVETPNVEFGLESEVFGKALRSPTGSVYSTDFTAEYNLKPDHSMFGVREHMAVSLWAGEKLVGFICVDNLISNRPFTDEQKEMLRLLSGFVGIAVENMRLVEQRERRTGLLEKVWRVSREISRITDFRSCILQIRNTVISEFEFDRAAVWLHDPKTDTFCGTFGTGRNGELIDEWNQRIRGDLTVRKALGQPSGVFHTSDYSAAFVPITPIMEGVKEHITVSFWAGDKPVGVITADMLLSQRSISEEQIEALRLFSSYAGIAIENALLVEELKQRTEQQELLTRLVHIASQRLDIYNLSYEVVRELSEVMRETALFVFVAVGEDNMVLNAANDIGHESLTQIGIPIGASFTKSQIDLTEGEPDSSNFFQVDDISQVNHPLLRLFASEGFRSLLLAKIVWRDEWIGALAALRKQPDAFTEDESSFLKTIADHLAVAFHNARLFEELQRTVEELRHTRDALIRQERLQALGQMTSGIVHDINNALVPILTFAELLEGMRNESLQEVTKHVKRAVDDIVNTIQRLRTFYRARGPAEEFEPLNLNEVVQHVVSATKPRWYDMPQRDGITVEVELDLDENLLTIMGNESELRQAFINLLFNAVDAVLAKGEKLGVIRVRTRRHEDWAILEIADTGVGMDEETKKRCFEPFFTTKKEETGSGLGLSMVYGIVKRHEGKIEVESELGQGTLFRIWFPIVKGTAALVKQSEESTIEILSLRVLVIDDD